MTSPDRYAVIGHPVQHSLSPLIHTRFAAQSGQAMVYGTLDVTAEHFAAAVREFFAGGGRGLNVTLPHKQAAAGLASNLSARAALAGAANTLAAQPDGTILGDNTDGAGLVHDLLVNHGVPIQGARVLLVGAGGAARGVLAPLLGLNPAVLQIRNRTAASAERLRAEFSHLGAVQSAPLAEASPLPFHVIINATSAGLSEQVPALGPGAVAPDTFCYDMLYGSTLSRFERWARASGARRTASGLGMLVEQAAESFALWRGVRPQTAPVLQALRQQLGIPA